MRSARGCKIARQGLHALAASCLWAAASGMAFAGCTVSSSGLAFGAYQPLTFPGKLTSSDVTSTAGISVVCTGIVTGGSLTVSLGAGSYGSGDRISTRYMGNIAKGGAYMGYNLYTDAGYATVWGNGTTGALLNGSIPTGASDQSLTVYGRIPAGQNTLKAGNFSDTLTMTLTYNP